MPIRPSVGDLAAPLVVVLARRRLKDERETKTPARNGRVQAGQDGPLFLRPGRGQDLLERFHAFGRAEKNVFRVRYQAYVAAHGGNPLGRAGGRFGEIQQVREKSWVPRFAKGPRRRLPHVLVRVGQRAAQGRAEALVRQHAPGLKQSATGLRAGTGDPVYDRLGIHADPPALKAQASRAQGVSRLITSGIIFGLNHQHDEGGNILRLRQLSQRRE